MPGMTNPYDALVSFEQALRAKTITIQRCELDPKLFVHQDMPDGETPRFTYVRLSQGSVKVLVNLSMTEPYEGLPCFQIGAAVGKAYRGQGLSQPAMEAAIAEMQNGLGRAGLKEFVIESIVGMDNLASQKITAATISDQPKEIVDEISGEPALQYIRRVKAG